MNYYYELSAMSSIKVSSFGYGGHEREREREREFVFVKCLNNMITLSFEFKYTNRVGK